MRQILKTSILVGIAAATALGSFAEANAGSRNRTLTTVQRSDNGDLLAAGVLGLAFGAIAAGVLANAAEDEPVEVNPYRHPRPSLDREVVFGATIPAPDPVVVYDDTDYEQSFEPWSRSWYRYCEDRYASFDDQTGTFLGRDGVERFCVAD